MQPPPPPTWSVVPILSNMESKLSISRFSDGIFWSRSGRGLIAPEQVTRSCPVQPPRPKGTTGSTRKSSLPQPEARDAPRALLRGASRAGPRPSKPPPIYSMEEQRKHHPRPSRANTRPQLHSGAIRRIRTQPEPARANPQVDPRRCRTRLYACSIYQYTLHNCRKTKSHPSGYSRC